MHRPFVAFAIAACVAGSVYAASAFDAADSGTRTVTAAVVGDSAAYLALAERTASPHAGFVTETSNKVVVSFAASGNGGTGVNPESVYYFDDILQVTNQGTATVYVQVTAASTTGSVMACHKTTTAAMSNSCYAASSPTTPASIAVGATHYIGIKVDATGLSSGNVAGTLSVVACRSSSC